MERKTRVLIAKPGLDGHDRGAKIVARALSEAGMEVIYTGLHQTPEQIVATAIQEGVDGVGLSILSGAHMAHIRSVLRLLKKEKVEDIFVFVGGIIPEKDVLRLRGMGVLGVFTPGAATSDIIDFVREAITKGTR
jgi:methylmalonyl-CoA mutase C-terminal domain/subunit